MSSTSRLLVPQSSNKNKYDSAKSDQVMIEIIRHLSRYVNETTTPLLDEHDIETISKAKIN